jgi:hypothetical protein
MTARILSSLAIAAAACSGGGGARATAPRAPATCDDAAAVLAESGAANRRWHAEGAGTSIDDAELARFAAEVAAVAADACRHDAWSTATIDCFAAAPVEAVAAPGEGAINGCAKLLTCAQRHAYIAAFREDKAYPGPDACE